MYLKDLSFPDNELEDLLREVVSFQHISLPLVEKNFKVEESLKELGLHQLPPYEVLCHIVEKLSLFDDLPPGKEEVDGFYLVEWMSLLGVHLHLCQKRNELGKMEELVNLANGEVLSVLLSFKPDLNMPDDDGYTPLMVAIERNDYLKMATLIIYGANLNAWTYDGQTVESFLTPQSKLFLEKWFDFCHRKHGFAPLRERIDFWPDETEEDEAQVDKLELTRGEWRDLWDMGWYGEKTVESLEEGAALSKVMFLLRNDEPETVPNKAQCTELFQKLLDTGMDINTQEDESGYFFSALHQAVYGDRSDYVALLLMLGADHSLEDDDGQTPLFKAMEGTNKHLIRNLLEHGAKWTVKDSIRCTPLHAASPVALECLEEWKADVSAKKQAKKLKKTLPQANGDPRDKSKDRI